VLLVLPFARSSVRKVLEIMGMTQVFKITET